MKDKVMGFKLYGAPWYITIAACAIAWICMYTGSLATNMAGTLLLMLAIGVPLYELGNRIPIWNTYIGGGILLAFLGTAFLNYLHWIPEKYVKAIDGFTGKPVNFLTVFIIILITGSVLSLDRKVLMRSFFGYIPAILGGLVLAAVLGILGGLLFSVKPGRIITHYVLPIMGGGNGGGAIPLSQTYEAVTGVSQKVYYAFAIIILTVANIFAIFGAALLNKLGNFKKNWTGDKATLIRANMGKSNMSQELEQKAAASTVKDIAGALLLGLSCYGVGLLFSKWILPKFHIGSAEIKIHTLAWMIIFVVILTATGVVPENIRMGAKRLQSFFSKTLTLVIMVGVGIDMNLVELGKAITVQNVVIAILIVLGAIIGSALVGHWVGFFPIDTAVTAGLCMANRGGSGDLAVLGAADRMDLMAYAQLSSRLGGAIVLIIASFCFSLL